jgi:hypothetical protein
VERLIWGRFPNAPAERGIRALMDVAEEFRAKIVFFHEVLETLQYGSEIERAARYVLERGHDLQLHAHIEFLPPEFWARCGYHRPTWAMNLFDEKTARLVIDYGVELFERMAGHRPIAFRAGAFRYNQSMLQALAFAGIPLSFQYYPATAHKPTYPHGFDAGVLPVFRWSNGIVEVPVGVYENRHPRQQLPRYKGFEFEQLLAPQQPRMMMEQIRSRGPEYRVFVLVLHSWSLLHKNESNHYVWKDDSLVEKFREFLGHLPPDVRIVSATELLAEIQAGRVKTAFEMPLPVAGTEAIPLRPLDANATPQPKVPDQAAHGGVAAPGTGMG